MCLCACVCVCVCLCVCVCAEEGGNDYILVIHKPASKHEQLSQEEGYWVHTKILEFCWLDANSTKRSGHQLTSMHVENVFFIYQFTCLQCPLKLCINS